MQKIDPPTDFLHNKTNNKPILIPRGLTSGGPDLTPNPSHLFKKIGAVVNFWIMITPSIFQVENTKKTCLKPPPIGLRFLDGAWEMVILSFFWGGPPW